MWLALVVGCAQTIVLDPPPVAATGEGCEGATSSERVQVSFAARDAGCAWGEGGNLDPEQGEVSARVEERVALDLGGGALCEMALAFEEQTLAFDDAFLLTFGDVILASSYAPMIEVFEADGLFRLYDWSRLAGYAYDYWESDTYCLGAREGLATCTVPFAETPGPIALDFEDSLLRALVGRAQATGASSFGFVTVGDDDPDADCSHSALSFAVDVTYAPD